MPGNGLNFHPEARQPMMVLSHLHLAIRPHHIRPFCVRGPREAEIGRLHDSARDAWLAIRAYCAARHCSASVRLFTADGHLWRENEISRDGRSSRTWPSAMQDN